MISPRLLAAIVLGLLGVNLSGAALKVACIGDSITAGAGLSNPAVESYPAKLQQLAGADFQVRNYGVSGRTLLRKGDFPYWKESAFKQSHDWNPDIVIIKLGTNDSKPPNWRHGTNFVTDCEDLIASYADLTSHPRILLCTPCPVFGNGAFDIKPGTIATNIAPALRELATRLSLQVIDLHVSVAGHEEWFPDTVHPNSKGTTVMATLVRTALVGGPSTDTAPSMEIDRAPANRAVLKWPTDSAGWVLQSATALTGKTAWTVVEQVAANDGSFVRVTNTISGPAKLYRLWNPSL